MVEIAGNADPPVVKIVDFKKFKYEEDKKERKAKKSIHQVTTKEIWLSPTISQHDLEIRAERARTFLKIGDRVKMTVKFPGRTITHPELGRRVLEETTLKLEGFGEKDSEQKFVGREMSLSFKPVRK